jgi:hypothetical protein
MDMRVKTVWTILAILVLVLGAATAAFAKPRQTPAANDVNGASVPGAPPSTPSVPASRFACPTITVPALGADTPDWPSTHGAQTGRMTRDGVPSVCGAPKPACPGVWDATGSRTYDAYQFDNDTGAPVCVTVTIDTACADTNFLFMVAYLGAYDPVALCTNYLADIGGSPILTATMGFDLPVGATVTVVVHEVTPAAGCATGYSLTVTGIGCAAGLVLQTAAMTDVCSGGGPGSGDGILDSGEDASFSVSLKNFGTTAITGISGVISCTDPLVTVTHPNASWPDLAAMGSAPNNPADFSIYLNPAAPCGTVLPFSLALTANEGIWTGAFDVTVGSVTQPVLDLINESFSTWPLTGWTITDDNASGAPWGSGLGYACQANVTGGSGDFATADSDCLGSAVVSTMISPAFDLSGAYATAQLQFKTEIEDYYGTTDGSVDLSTDGGATWPVNLQHFVPSWGSPIMGTYTYDISSAIGSPNVKVRFLYYTNDWEMWWQVDDFVVTVAGAPSCTMNPCVGATCVVTCSASPAPTSGTIPLTVAFTSSVTVTGCASTPTYAWDFGDGATDTAANPTHVYVTAGTFHWTLTVTAGTTTCTTTGTVTAGAFDMTFFDDYGRSSLCVNGTTGAFSYNVLRGFGLGTYSGTGVITRFNGVMTLQTPAGLPYSMTLKYLERYHKATATFTNRPARVQSTLMDNNTMNNPPVCGP